jgi:hypothetical protein
MKIESINISKSEQKVSANHKKQRLLNLGDRFANLQNRLL